MLIDGLESCGLLVDYCDYFISSSKSVPMKNKTPLHLGFTFINLADTFIQSDFQFGEYIKQFILRGK